jgi:SAM-dependent methyltransferase
MYSLDAKHFFRLALFGLAAWLPAMAGLLLTTWGAVAPLASSLLGSAGAVAIVGLSLWRSLQKKEPVLRLSHVPSRDMRGQRWADVGNPKAIHACRWAMYESLSQWLNERDWSGKTVGEVGGSNGALRSFVSDARYRQLTYPEYDVQNLQQVQDNEFDLVILDQVLEHLPNPDLAMREIHRVLKPNGFAIVTTPFLVPVHRGTNFGDYYRWTPQGMETFLRRSGFEPRVRMWGNFKAAKTVMEEMYVLADRALNLGLDLLSSDAEGTFPITVWATARSVKDA